MPRSMSSKTSKLSQWKLLRLAASYCWPANWALRIDLLLSITFLILGNVADLGTPLALKAAVNALGSKEEPRFPWEAIAVYGAMRFAGNAFGQLRDVMFATVSSETERTASLDAFKHILGLSINFHINRETGAVMRSIGRGAQSFSTLFRIALFQFAPILLQVTAVAIYLTLRYSIKYAAINITIIVVYVLYTVITTRWRDNQRRVMNEKESLFSQRALDALLNIQTIKTFSGEHHEAERYDSALRDYTRANISVQRSLGLLNAGQNFIISAGVVGALWLAGREVVEGSMNIGDFVLIQSFILQLYQPLGFLGTLTRMLRQSFVDCEQLFALLSEERDVRDEPDALDLVVKQGRIEFRDVHFHYKNEVPILRGISFTVEPGQKVALVGSTGSGKSTCMSLLFRFFDPQQGSILIDGQDIKKVKQVSLRSQIAIVPQDTCLWNDTLEYNIKYGRRDANRAEIEEAAHRAQLDSFLEAQPGDPFQVRVGERGVRVSGGERQRIAISRAIIKHPAIMLFDEATSALDTATEIEIQNALDEVSKDVTTIAVAHRLSTIVNSDIIHVLQKGVIAESGTHEQLMLRGGLYATMYKRQLKSRELERNLQTLQKFDSVPSELPASASMQEMEAHLLKKTTSQPSEISVVIDRNGLSAQHIHNDRAAAASPKKKASQKSRKHKKDLSHQDELRQPLLTDQDQQSEDDSLETGAQGRTADKV